MYILPYFQVELDIEKINCKHFSRLGFLYQAYSDSPTPDRLIIICSAVLAHIDRI